MSPVGSRRFLYSCDHFVVQGWSSVIPKFSILDFISFYVEVPVMIVMTVLWLFASRIRGKRSAYSSTDSSPETQVLLAQPQTETGSRLWDLIDVETVDLLKDEYDEPAGSLDEETGKESKGYRRILRKLYNWVV